MKIFPHIEQGSEEWKQLRVKYFTASTLGDWLIEEPKLTLTVEEIRSHLTAQGIDFDKKALRPALIESLPNEIYLAHLTYTGRRNDAWEGAIETRLGNIAEDEEPEWDTWATKRGKALEQDARIFYENRTRLSVKTVGFVAHDSNDFGCSPDGLALTLPIKELPEDADPAMFANGLELKSHIPRTHIRFLRRGGFREEHAMQVHASMASTGIREWHLFGYCPDLPDMLEVFKWDETTDRVLDGLLRLSEDYWTAFSELKSMHLASIHREGRAA